MTKQEFIGASGILLPGAITIPKDGEIAISQDWLIFPDAITGEGKVWTIDGLLEPCIKQDNEVWVDSTVENPFAGPITYKGKNKYGWLVGELTKDTNDELDYIDRKSIRNIILSNLVTEIPDKAFYECYDLQNIIISNSVLRIGNVAFYNCANIQTLTIPDTVTEMGGGVFYDCHDLKYVKLPNTLTHLDFYLYTDEAEGWSKDMGFFQNCNNLLTIVLPQTLQSIGSDAFNNCRSITSVNIPNSVTSIGVNAFLYCRSLTSINIPTNVTSIGSGAFDGCYSLTIVTIGNSVTSIGDTTFRDCSSLTSITIPNSVTSIGVNAFYKCSSLTFVTIPDSVTSIGNGAFWDCSSLTTITISDSVTSIGYDAFYDTALQRIVSYSETPPAIEWSTFKNVAKYIPLEVPNADLYREAPYWQEFYNIYNINPHQLNVSSNNEEWGYVRILEHNTNRSVIEAYYKDGYVFKQWSDGNTDIWRELNITEDTTLVALFERAYIPSITRMDIISATPTSITIEFEVVCDEERLYFDDGYISYYTDLDLNSIPTSREFGVLEITIDGLNPDTNYDIVLHIKNNAHCELEHGLEFTTPSLPYSYVDLGLPSGTLWANKNVGAKNPWDNGLYFDWGNVEGHAVDENGNVTDGYSFDENTYANTEGSNYTGDDAATVNMGENWRMPTVDEYKELVNAVKSSDGTKGTLTCQYEYIDLNGEQQILKVYNDAEDGWFSAYGLEVDGSPIFKTILGIRFTNDATGASVYFPACGSVTGSILADIGLYGYYWSSSINDTTRARNFCFYPSNVIADYSTYRYFGMCVRGVINL